MAERVRAYDWASTPLGPMEQWPQSLKIALGICLNSRFPMFVWWGPQQINIYNDAYVPMLGKRHPAALGRPARESWNDIWAVVGPQAEAVLTRGEATWNERVVLMMERHGYLEETYFTWSYSPIYDESGAIGGMFCAVVEETPRVMAERARDRLLRENETERVRLEEAFEKSPSFLAILRGPDHVFEFANERYEALVGHREIIGRPVVEALPEVRGQGFVEILDQVYRTGDPFVGNSVRVELREAGSPRLATVYLDFVYQPMRDPEGQVVGILVHGVDVTHRELASAILRESERSFRQLADAMPQIVFTAGPDGQVDYFNRQWYEYTGLPEGDVSRATWEKVHTPDGLARVQEAWPHALRTGEPYEIEYELRRHDGEYRWHLGRALPIRDEHGHIVRWYGTNTDIHDRKRIEQALAQALQAEQHARGQAEQASRMKDEFLATLSHELRTPLNAILGWAHLIRRPDAKPAELAKAAEVIDRNARSQATIIEDLLDMSAIMSGKVRLAMKPVDLAQVVSAAIETSQPPAVAKSVTMAAHVAAADDMTVIGDADRLQQVLWNLLTNAVKFTPRGGRVEVHAERTATHVELRVSDTGEGIASDFLPHVFDRFRQADASSARRHGGLGLGLSIVKQLVELHGGSVAVASEGKARGTTFTVCLPVAARALAAAETGAHATRTDDAARHERYAERGQLEGVRVLVVDDEGDARELLQRLLEGAGARTAVAGSTGQALALVGEQRFDVIVSDIGMPGEDGYQLIRRLRERHDAAALPAVALTAYAREEDRAKVIAAGFQQHLAKPLDPVRVVSTIASLIRTPAP
jgi:PAS domain S-box-containing protein